MTIPRIFVLMTQTVLLAVLLAVFLNGCADKNGRGDDEENTYVQADKKSDNKDSGTQKTAEKKLVKTTAVPGWVVERKTGEFPKNRLKEVKNGIAYHLSDTQVKKTKTGYEYFFRIVFEVTERSGLETAAKISTKFDPAHEELYFTNIDIRRNSKTQNRLPGVEIKELQREADLEKGLMYGDITALINLEDIRVGDIVSYSFVKKTQTPLWPDEYFSTLDVGWSVPLVNFYYRLMMPADKKVYFKSYNIDLPIKITEEGAYKVYNLDLHDPDIEKTFNNIPVGVISSKTVAVSSFDNWGQIADWGADIYNIDYKLPQDFVKKLDKIARKYPSKKDRMTEALRLVQENIRYLGIELGTGSYIPRLPETTLQRGYGDCKDKTVLLIAALEVLGIDAVPVLANIDGGHLLHQLLPSIGAFDHVIARANIDGKDYWLDPTSSYQGGRGDRLVMPDYGYVLPMVKGQKELVLINVEEPKQPQQIVKEKYTFPDKGENGLLLDVESTYYNARADNMRRHIKKNGKAGLSKSYLDYYHKTIPDIEQVSTVEIIDDIDANKIIVKEHYKVSRANFDKNGFGEKLKVEASTITDVLPQNIGVDRKVEMGLYGHINRKHIITLYTPDRTLGIPEGEDKKVKGVIYKSSYRKNKDYVELEFDLVVKRSSLSLDEAKKLVGLAKHISSAADLRVNISKAIKTLKLRLGLEKEIPKQIKKALQDVAKYEEDGDKTKALAILAKTSKAYKHRDSLKGYLHIYRAGLLKAMDREKAAYPYYRKGFELYAPDWSSPYFNYVSLLYKKEKYEETADIIALYLENLPDEVHKINLDWIGRLSRKLVKKDNLQARNMLVISLATAMSNYQGEEELDHRDWIYRTAMEALAKKGKATKAGNFLPYIKNPKQFETILSSRSMQDLWLQAEEIAGKDLSKAIDSYVQYTKSLSKKEDAGFKEKTKYIGALSYAGKYRAAIDYAQSQIEEWTDVEAAGEDAFWFINSYAYILANAGYVNEADMLIDKLLKLGIDEHPSLVSMAINQVELNKRAGEYRRAIERAEKLFKMQAREKEGNIMSDVGEIYLYESLICSYYKAGKKNKAEKTYKEKFLPLAEKTPSMIAAQMQLLLCMDKLDEAEKLFVKRLSEEKYHSNVVNVFNATTKSTAPKNLKQMRQKILDLAERPQVKQLTDKLVRPIKIKGNMADWAEY